jgi:hypothetical protein
MVQNMPQEDQDMMWQPMLSSNTMPPVNSFGDVVVDPSLDLFSQHGFLGASDGGSRVGSGMIPFSDAGSGI